MLEIAIGILLAVVFAYLALAGTSAMSFVFELLKFNLKIGTYNRRRIIS